MRKFIFGFLFIGIAILSGVGAYMLLFALTPYSDTIIPPPISTETATIPPVTVEPIVKPTLSPSPTPEPETKYVRLSAVGDLMVHQWQMDNAYDKETKTYNFHHAFERIKPYIESADISVGNLETVLAGEAIGYSDFPRFNSPDTFAHAIAHAGFDLLTTANNHSNDKGEAGILRTLDILDELGIDHFGTYADEESRRDIYIREVNGIKFAFLSYTYGTNGLALPEGRYYLVNILNEELVRSDITRARELNPDFIIIMPHLGNEYELVPKQVFKNWVNMMINAGADIVLASHPHVLQPAEYITVTEQDGSERHCFVAYSMGNFISSQRTLPRDEGVIFNLYFEKEHNKKPKLTEVTFTPTWVKFMNKKGAYDIQVLSVYDTLIAVSNGEEVDLRTSDIERLKQIQAHTTELYTGKSVPVEEMQKEYKIE